MCNYISSKYMYIYIFSFLKSYYYDPFNPSCPDSNSQGIKKDQTVFAVALLLLTLQLTLDIIYTECQ